MSRSAAARSTPRHERTTRPPHAAPGPRRVSGPARGGRPPRAHVDAAALAMSDAVAVPRPSPRSLPSRPPLRIAASGGMTIAYRVAGVALDVSGSRAMDRVVRSRAWIVIVAFGLIGIVAMQVSLLKLNSGIGRAVETVATLERTNATLRSEVSRLSSGERIQSLAGTRGFVMPEPADITYLRAGDLRADGTRAARRMQAPDASVAGPAGAALAPSIPEVIAGPGSALAGAPPAAASPATTTTPPAATTTEPPVIADAPPPVAPATGAATAPPTTAATVAAPASTQSGGVIPAAEPAP